MLEVPTMAEAPKDITTIQIRKDTRTQLAAIGTMDDTFDTVIHSLINTSKNASNKDEGITKVVPKARGDGRCQLYLPAEYSGKTVRITIIE
jgi:hypothetical protein